MPSRNILRQDVAEGYYHVYARGIGKAPVFLSPEDKRYFMYLLARHLSIEPVVTKAGYAYPHYRDTIELLAFCLMDNHYHLLLYQRDAGMLSRLMKSITTGYVTYFNRKNGRTGPLFESRFKAALIQQEAHLIHISRYIHLNPRSWRRFPYSSYRYIASSTEPEWLRTEKVLADFQSRDEYAQFTAAYEEHKQMLDQVKSNLADT